MIVNADDFGQSDGINRGVFQSFESGIVTSASLMVRFAGAQAAAAYAREHPGLSVGLHFDLGEWAYRADTWVPVYTVLGHQDEGTVATEAARQLAAFQALVGRDPTHIDSHQHVHREEPVRSVLSALAARLSVPLRDVTDGIAYCGHFYGQTADGSPLPGVLTVESLLEIVAALPAGLHEVGCHPGLEDHNLESMYKDERPRELAVLCDPRVGAGLAAAGIELRSFRDVQLIEGDARLRQYA